MARVQAEACSVLKPLSAFCHVIGQFTFLEYMQTNFFFHVLVLSTSLNSVVNSHRLATREGAGK